MSLLCWSVPTYKQVNAIVAEMELHGNLNLIYGRRSSEDRGYSAKSVTEHTAESDSAMRCWRKAR